jgi:hypothetical protein
VLPAEGLAPALPSFKERLEFPMQIEPTWWISVIEVPVVAALFRMIYMLKQDIQNRIDRGDTRDSEAMSRTREDLAEFKLEVARTYVPLSLIRDVDQRLSSHLLRIEGKLEGLRRGDHPHEHRNYGRRAEDRP